MRRRELITLLGGAAAAWPLAARAQQSAGKTPRVGFLYGGVSGALASRVDAFLEGMRGNEWQEIQVVSRVAEGDPVRLPALAKELLNQNIDVLFAGGPAAVQAAHAETRTVPVVALDLETDPVESRLVASLSHPGGNLTGIFFDFPEFSTKWMQFLRELAPKLSRLAVFWDPSTGPLQLHAVQRVAGSMGFTLRVVEVVNAGELEQAFSVVRKENLEGLLLLSSPIFGSNATISAKLTLEHRLPAVSMFPEFAHAGGLIAYGPNLLDLFRQSGVMTAKVLRNKRPADIPVERPVRMQLVINLKTAAALGIDVPPGLLIRADEVIE
jgi:ABC-type uncharacterized transport system substrate-binding protein